MNSLVIFDLWNTLIRANGPRFVDRMANCISEYSGRDIAVDTVVDFIRSTGCLHEEIAVEDLATEFWRYEIGGTPPFSLAARVNDHHHEFVKRAEFFDGAIESLGALREHGFSIAVVSNATSASLEVIDRLSIPDFVDEIWISCRSGFLKPDPRAFLTAAEHFGVKPSSCYVIGDKMTTDILGARLANMNAVLIDASAPEIFINPNASMLAVAPSVQSIDALLHEAMAGEETDGAREQRKTASY